MIDRHCKHWGSTLGGATQLGRLEVTILRYPDERPTDPMDQTPPKVQRMQMLLCDACTEELRHWLELRNRGSERDGSKRDAPG